MSKNIKFLLLILVILAVIVIGCDSSSKPLGHKKGEQLDKVKNDALKRNATVVAEESKRLNLSVCPAGEICAKDGKDCKVNVPASEPGVCAKGPTLTCVCPEKKICLMTAVSLDSNLGTCQG